MATPTTRPTWDNGDLKEVRFSIIVRTRAADQDFDAGNFVVNGKPDRACGRK